MRNIIAAIVLGLAINACGKSVDKDKELGSITHTEFVEVAVENPCPCLSPEPEVDEHEGPSPTPSDEPGPSPSEEPIPEPSVSPAPDVICIVFRVPEYKNGHFIGYRPKKVCKAPCND